MSFNGSAAKTAAVILFSGRVPAPGQNCRRSIMTKMWAKMLGCNIKAKLQNQGCHVMFVK